MINNTFGTNTLRLAVVTQVYPEGQKLEVMFLDTGDYGRDVQVMTPYAGTDFGFTSGIPAPEEEGHDPNKEIDPDKRHIVAVIATLQGRHICMGFLFPQITHMAFTKDKDKNRLIERHTSDFYRTINDAGDMDMVHPSDAFIRIGAGNAPDKLEKKDYDERWKIQHNTKKAVTISIHNHSGDGQQKKTTYVRLYPSGNIDIYADENISIRAGKNVNINAGEDIAMTAGGKITGTAGEVKFKAGMSSIDIAGSGITNTAPKITEATPIHNTTGIHTDSIGIHTSA